MIVTADKGVKTIIDTLGLSISVFDYVDNNYLEQMNVVDLTTSTQLQ